jgi:hypothetical protein
MVSVNQLEKKIEAKELLPEYKPDLGGRLSGEQCP